MTNRTDLGKVGAMLSRPEKLPFVLTALALALLTVATHALLVPVGLAFHNSELSSFLAVADRFREGYRSAFPFQNNHGGLTITVLRAFFTAAWDGLMRDPWHHERGHMVFSYILCPPLITVSAYYYLRRAFNAMTALVMGVVCAVGLHVWVVNYGNEFYPLMLICGFLMMGLCAHKENPFFELKPGALFLFGLLGGHGIYATRSSQLYLVALLIPWRFVPGWTRELWATALGKVFLLLWASGIYLEVTGDQLGTIAGKMIKLDGDPHFAIAIPALALLWAWKRKAVLKKADVRRRIALLSCGLITGLLPELVHWMLKGKLWGSRIISTYDFEQSLEILATLPVHFKSLVSGQHHYRMPLQYWDQGIGQHLCVVLVLVAMGHALSAARKTPSLWALPALCALNLFSYTRVSVQTTEIAPVRYLMPMTPALIGMLALWWQNQKASSKGWQSRTVIATALLVLFVGHHLAARARVVNYIREQRIVENLHSTIETFRKAGVSVVITDDYWMSNNLTVAAYNNPVFWATWNGWGPFDAEAMAKKARRSGILLQHHDDMVFPRLYADELDNRWRLTPLARIGAHELYTGDAL